MVRPLTVYKASAGSGKTFTLATEYISLLVENPMSYCTILAVTFTNKATEEMKMRILSQLYGIWKQLPDSDNYLKVVQEKTGLDTKVISERAGISLSNLLNNYNYFRVETIDTFFQSVMRNMARELDLTTNLRIGLNDVQVEELAVDQLIADLSTTDAMLQWILRYIMENISDDKSWNVIGQIKQFGRHIFSDAYKNVSHTLEEKLAEPGFFDQYTTRLRELRQSAGERMKQFADTFLSMTSPTASRVSVASSSSFARDSSMMASRANASPTVWVIHRNGIRRLIRVVNLSTLWLTVPSAVCYDKPSRNGPVSGDFTSLPISLCVTSASCVC